MSNQSTKSTDLVIPEVFGGLVTEKVKGKMLISNFATFSDELKGVAGDTVKFPKWSLLGDAEEFTEEGFKLTTDKLTQSTTEEKIKQIGKATKVYDYALQVGLGDAIGQSASQISEVIARKIDTDLIAKAKTTPLQLSMGGTKIANTDLWGALDLYGDDANAEDFVGIVTHSANRQAFYTMDDFIKTDYTHTQEGNGIQRRNMLGYFLGIPVYISDKDMYDTTGKKGQTLLIKKDSLGLIMKKDVSIETARDILEKSTTISADVLYATALLNDAGVVLIK